MCPQVCKRKSRPKMMHKIRFDDCRTRLGVCLMSAKCQCLTRQVALLGNESLSSFHVIESSMSTCVCHIGGEYL